MVMATISSIDFNWRPEFVEVDNPRKVIPDYTVTEQAETSVDSIKTKFVDLPAFGLWKDHRESIDELLEELGSGWRGFAGEAEL